ncbi:NB-ARC domain-containing protein [Actinoplanes sp. DH11]|uniref:WD40 domain-containing protein n=1 Tax=Actinoplanes sp. DH11 TaxID=2857011 RepID=UPI001E339FF5|nr:NB-ARC domain-containing protein [Actinoplanes sp. DH11]
MLTVAVTQLAAAAINAATGKERWPGVLDLIRAYPFQAAGILTAVLAVLTAVAVWWTGRPAGHRADPPAPAVDPPPGWVIDRPDEVHRVVRALRRRPGRAVGITTALQGAGGFGKTTLARVVCADKRVRRRFKGRIYQITMGRDVRGAAAIAAKVGDVIHLITGDRPDLTDPDLAGAHLSRLLDERPRLLLVIDDVWEADQVAPFLVGGRRCVRLVTTRIPATLSDAHDAVLVPVDQMSPDQARAVLTWELPPMPPGITEQLLAVTGRWPLLLRLINRALADEVSTGADAGQAAGAWVALLAARGPGAADDRPVTENDLDVPRLRARLVRATIEASTRLLSNDVADGGRGGGSGVVGGGGSGVVGGGGSGVGGGGEPARLAELGVFVEDETVPVTLVAELWQRTAGLDLSESRRLCRRLADLSLISVKRDGTVTLHDVVRAFLREELGDRITELNGALADAVAGRVTAWWQLGEDERYLWEHLITHLCDAGRADEALAAARDLRWVAARLRGYGPAAPIRDLLTTGLPEAAALVAGLTRAAHLLAPTDPPHFVVDVLLSRLQEEPLWREQAAAMQDATERPILVNRWPLPDMPNPAIRRILPGATNATHAVVVSPDGEWIACSHYHDVRIWEVVTGRRIATLRGEDGWITALALAPDGAWLATGGNNGKIRIWDVTTAEVVTTLIGHAGGVFTLAITPDGGRLVSAGHDGAVQIWDLAGMSGESHLTLDEHTGAVEAVVVAPDGTWLASGGSDRIVRVWDAADGRVVSTISGHRRAVNALAVSGDGTWVAASNSERAIQLYDMPTGRVRATLTGHSHRVASLASAPDGSWLVSASHDGTLRIWDTTTGAPRATLTGHTGRVEAIAVAPDGTWLVSAGEDGTVRIWESDARKAHTARTEEASAVAISRDGTWLAYVSDGWRIRTRDPGGRTQGVVADHDSWTRALAIAPDETWVVTAGDDNAAHLWDPSTGNLLKTLEGHTGVVEAVAVAPDGTWLATAGRDGTVRIWDSPTGGLRVVLRHTASVETVATAPDGTWLVCGGWDKTVRVWDVGTGALRLTLTGHDHVVSSVTVAADGTWLASADLSGRVHVRDATTGQIRTTLVGHEDSATAVAASPDGFRLASASNDRTLRVWDVATGRPVAMMRVDGRLRDCCWLPDGSGIVAAGDGGLYLFDLRTGGGHRALTLDPEIGSGQPEA